MQDGSQWMMLLRAVGSLALVIGLIFALAWAAKKYWRPERWAAQVGAIKILQSLNVGPKTRLMIVEVDGKRLLLGVGSESVNSLCILSDAVSSSRQLEAVEFEYAEKS